MCRRGSHYPVTAPAAMLAVPRQEHAAAKVHEQDGGNQQCNSTRHGDFLKVMDVANQQNAPVDYQRLTLERGHMDKSVAAFQQFHQLPANPGQYWPCLPS